TLGRFGQGLSWVLYISLFYSLTVAYISGSGSLLASLISFVQIPDWVGSLFFVLLFGWVVYLGTRSVDLWNRVLMVGKILCFLGLVFVGVEYVKPELLAHTDSSQALVALPVLIISFGFHNMVPTITHYMKGDLKRVKKVILGGSLLTLFVYLLWEIVVLGIVPEAQIKENLAQGKEASQAIADILGSSWVTKFAHGLAFFAMLTSFLAQSLALVHFLTDGFKAPSYKRENIWMCALALGPPLICSLIYPALFFKALSFAGGICTVILFGVMPATMVWLGRYWKEVPSTYQVFGGKTLLGGIFFFALFVFGFQIYSMI
ncbi:MAG TPA: aromatic amino acid transport family protein, partial [Rhabdochlamydiaceae bacterium]